ncbi:MAG: NADPH-dependent glutamate synthase [Oscillospiraceae bacterium]
MPNMSHTKVPMPEQPGDVRNKNFKEVSTGYTEEMALEEASRCLNCKTRPCVIGCPVNVNIPEFIRLILERDYTAAFYAISATNSLPAVTGRVCPQEYQCESKCPRSEDGEPVAIGRLERFVADWYLNTCSDKAVPTPKNGHKVAVIGSGPSGLSCAGDLAKLGYEVTIFEALHKAGGVLAYGIPEFRLPKNIVQRQIQALEDYGVKIMTNMIIGRVLSIDEIMEMGFEAIFIGSGAELPRFLGIPGEGSAGVYSANEYLTRINLMKAYSPRYNTPIISSKSIAIVGGGNVAMDAARCAKRMGAENVYIVYRRSDQELPARKEEVHHAQQEGIIFKTLTSPLEITHNESGWVTGIRCAETELGEPDKSGRRKATPKPDSEFILDVDSVVIAIGTSPNPLIRTTTVGIQANEKGCLVVNQDMLTTRKGVFAGGDAVTGSATVILAMGAGKKAAKSIDDYISKKQFKA